MNQTEREKFNRLIDSKRKSRIRKAVGLFTQEGRESLLSSRLWDLLTMGFLEEIQSTVLWCLQNEKELGYAILAAGKLPGIPLDLFAKFAEHEDPMVKASCLRAMEFRIGDKQFSQKLVSLFNDLLPKIKSEDNASMWTGLFILDGILEFEGKDLAIKLLRIYYDTLDPIMGFPLRQAWERLKIVGVKIPHETFDNSGHMLPSYWLSRKRPFYVDISDKVG